MVVMAPANENECRQMLTTGYHYNGPAAVRYPRGTGVGVEVSTELDTIEIGVAEPRRQGSKVAILAFGTLLANAEKAAEQIDATVINMRFVKPLDTAMINKVAGEHGLIVTVEENAVMGGAGSAVSEYLREQQINTPLIQLGLPDEFIDHGVQKDMLAACGLDAIGIIDTINRFFHA
jgi:1-deoxy-D-xylulose-5-phosphate synthase